MDQQQLRLTRDAELHRALFDVMLAAYEAGDTDAAAAPVSELLHWLKTDEAPKPAARFEAMRALFVLGVSLAPEAPSRNTAARLLTEFGLHALPPEPGDDPLRLSLRNNHLLLQAACLLAWPEMAGAREAASLLTHRYLTGMDDAGRFPSELCRGASALWYSNLAVMLLTSIAFADQENAAPMVTPDTLARAIHGLADALRDPALIQAQARRNLFAHPDHGADPNQLDCGFLSGYRRSRHYMAWTVLAGEVLGPDAVPLAVPPDDRFPLCSDFIGGFVQTRLRAGA